MEKRCNAIVLGGTSDKMFAVGTFLISFFRHNPSIDTDVIIYHDGISEIDAKALSLIHPCSFREYKPPFPDGVHWHKNVEYFTQMVFSKYECLRLLDEYQTVIWFDYDMLVVDQLNELFEPVSGGLRLITVETVGDFVMGEITNPELAKFRDAPGVHASCMAFYDTLPNSKKLYQWCLDATVLYSADLGCPDQVVFSVMVNEFELDVYPLCFELYSPHPIKKGVRRTDRYVKIWHSYREKKFWDYDFNDDEWNTCFISYVGTKHSCLCKIAHGEQSPVDEVPPERNRMQHASPFAHNVALLKFIPQSRGSFSQSDVFWELQSGKTVVIDIQGVQFSVDNPEALHRAILEFIGVGLVAEARALNVALIALEAFLQRPVPLSLPRVIQVETTNACNAECIMCKHYYSDNQGVQHVDIGVFESLKTAFPLVEGVVLHGYGEPFINPNLETILSLLDHENVLVSTNTNLSILPAFTYERFAHLFHEINVSCDACEKELYEGIRKRLSFERFKANAGKLRDCFPQTRLTLAVTVMRQNLENLADLVQFAHDMRFDAITFNEMAPDIIIGNFIDTPNRNFNQSCAALQEAVNRAMILGIDISAPQHFIGANAKLANPCETRKYRLFPSDRHQKSLKQKFGREQERMRKFNSELLDTLTSDFNEFESLEGICDWVVEKSYVDIEGNVFPCCTGYPQHGEPLGNIYDAEFVDIWRGKLYSNMRAAFYQKHIPHGCNGCCFVRSGSLPMLKTEFSDSGVPRTRIREGTDAEVFASQQGLAYENDLIIVE